MASPVVLATRTFTLEAPMMGSCAVSGADSKNALWPGRKAPSPPARLNALPNPGSADTADGAAPAGARRTLLLLVMARATEVVARGSEVPICTRASGAESCEEIAAALWVN
ncbi:unannotated protein [freshwater metagenome]|uniref:Unannotated protein n=1 Tax=freshwater metagenome TaxID=449393 RepID=A0A6J7FHQ8_9ZZZZ